VIRAGDPAGLTAARFADSGQVQVGDVVLAVGNPLGLTSSVTEGIVSATGRAVAEPATPESPGATLPGVIQISAPINPGNSGGALVSLSGQCIGIPTLAAASSLNGAPAPGVGFAIPSSTVRDTTGQIIASGPVTSSHRAALGAGGPADRAGLGPGDVIRSAASVPTPTAEALSQTLAATRPGQTITVAIIRSQQSRTVPVTLGQLPGR
jgi:S1-C subfamily serine protease